MKAFFFQQNLKKNGNIFFWQKPLEDKKNFQIYFFLSNTSKIAAEKFQVDTSSGFGGIFEN